MSKSQKCGKCNNRTRDSSGYCYLHSAGGDTSAGTSLASIPLLRASEQASFSKEAESFPDVDPIMLPFDGHPSYTSAQVLGQSVAGLDHTPESRESRMYYVGVYREQKRYVEDGLLQQVWGDEPVTLEVPDELLEYVDPTGDGSTFLVPKEKAEEVMYKVRRVVIEQAPESAWSSRDSREAALRTE